MPYKTDGGLKAFKMEEDSDVVQVCLNDAEDADTETVEDSSSTDCEITRSEKTCSCDIVPDHCTQSVSSEKLTKSMKKKLRHAHIVDERKKNRRQKKLDRKMRLQEQNKDQDVADRPSKREIQEIIRDKLQQGLICGQRICVDLGMEHTMSIKEKSKLAQQIGRLYGANRRSEYPAHVYLCGLENDGELYQECVRKNDGFCDYMMERTEKSFLELFDVEDIIYLSPDSEEMLTDIDKDKVYIIGGLVDESVNKNLTQKTAESHKIQTRKLPISLYMSKVEQSFYSQILSVNQVFEILVTFISTKDWRRALSVGVPKRKGYILKEDII